MIVVDTNILAQFWLQSDHSELCEQLFQKSWNWTYLRHSRDAQGRCYPGLHPGLSYRRCLTACSMLQVLRLKRSFLDEKPAPILKNPWIPGTFTACSKNENSATATYYLLPTTPKFSRIFQGPAWPWWIITKL